MKIMAIDDEALALQRLERAVEAAVPGCALRGFTDPVEALESAAGGFLPDVAFLDIQMFGMDGIELAKRLKDCSPNTRVIFVTAYSEYALEAFSIHARGYLLKPATPERVREEMESLSIPSTAPVPRVRVHTFGSFEVFVDGKPVSFRRSKSKEVLAYLVDRKGASVTKREIAAVLWENRQYSRSDQVYLQALLTEMMRALRAVGAEQIVRKGYNSFSVDPTQFDCDYYRFERWDVDAVNSYRGEYMSNYSWAEFTVGYLEMQSSR